MKASLQSRTPSIASTSRLNLRQSNMSSCPVCWQRKNSCKRTSNTARIHLLCRASSARRRSRPRFQEIIVHLVQYSVAYVTLTASGIVIHLYEASHGRALTLASLDVEGVDLGRKTDATLPAFFCGFQAGTGQDSILVKMTTRIASLADTLHITRLVEDPSPHLFLAACLLFAFVVATLQHLHKEDRYLNRILVAGWVVGCAAAFRTTNAWMEMKSYLALSTVLALLLSVLVHFAIRLWQGHRELDDAPETECRLCDQSCEKQGIQGDDFRNVLEIDEIGGN